MVDTIRVPVHSQTYEPAVDLATLVDHPRNPRRGDDASVLRSIDVNGWYGAIIAQLSTGRVLAGHTRRRALLAKGETTAPVIWLDCDDATALHVLLADNRTAELAVWDESTLLDVLRDLEPDPHALEAVSFDAEDMAQLARKVDILSGELNAHEEWLAAGMPEYDSQDHMWAYRTVVHFASEEDADAFFAMIERPKQKIMWWPQSDDHTDRSDGHVVAEIVS